MQDSPELAKHLYKPRFYKETLSANAELLNKYSGVPEEDLHRPVTNALLQPFADQASLQQTKKSNEIGIGLGGTLSATGGYDLAELRRKLEERMEYA